MDKFDRILSSVIDSHLGLRSRLIAYLENRDGNANVRFMQAETHRRFFKMMRSFGIHVRSFRADCGSWESWGQVFDSIITFLAYRRLSREVH